MSAAHHSAAAALRGGGAAAFLTRCAAWTVGVLGVAVAVLLIRSGHVALGVTLAPCALAVALAVRLLAAQLPGRAQ